MNNPVRYIDPSGRNIFDFIGGILHAFGSNLTLGMQRSDTEFVSNASHYNAGRVVGDVISIVAGGAEAIQGGGMVLGGAGAVVVSKGAATPVATPGMAAGAIEASHGILVVGNAIKNMATGEGHISKASASGSRSKSKKMPNPDGSKGKSDHQKAVDDLVEKATNENPGMTIIREGKIQKSGSNRRPDVQVIDPKTKQTNRIYEAEKRPNSKRNKLREAEYDRLGIEHETHKVGN